MCMETELVMVRGRSSSGCAWLVRWLVQCWVDAGMLWQMWPPVIRSVLMGAPVCAGSG